MREALITFVVYTYDIYPDSESHRLRTSLLSRLTLVKKKMTKEDEMFVLLLQSIYVTHDRIFLKFEARVQIYMAVLNICCEIQNSGWNVVRFSKINSYEISFWLFLFKNMRNIRFLGVW